jgi:hypothetical protein
MTRLAICRWIIVVGQSLDDIFAPWWRQAFEIGALIVALCVVT